MRTRFLTTDYFFPESPIGTLHQFRFLPLSPPPALSSFDPSPVTEIDLCDTGRDLELPLEIDGLPIERALSDFLFDVIPRRLDVDSATRSVFRSEKNKNHESTEDDEVALEKERWCLDFVLDSWIDEVEEGSGFEKQLCFELVEMELPMNNSIRYSMDEDDGLCFMVPSIKIPLKHIDIEDRIEIPYPHMMAESICLIEDVHASLLDNFDHYSVKDGYSSFNKVIDALRLPQFEIRKDTSDIDADVSGIEVFTSLLPSILSLHEVQGDDFRGNTTEFSRSTSANLLEQFLGDASMDKSLEQTPPVIDIDPTHICDTDFLEGGSAIYENTDDGLSSQMPCSMHLQEVHILDSPPADILQSFVSSQSAKTPEIPEKMFIDDMELAGRLYDFIVSYDLNLADDAFKSMPTPILSDDRAIKSINEVIKDVLCSLRPHPSSACDSIYLDWHPLHEGPCNREICSAFICFIEEVDICEMIQTDYEEATLFDVRFFDDFQKNVGYLDEDFSTVKFHEDAQQDVYPFIKPEVTIMPKDKYRIANDEEINSKVVSDKSSFLFESMSQPNDLNYYLDVRGGKTKRYCQDETIKRSGKVVQSTKPSDPCATRWAIEIHKVSLSEPILVLMESINETYVVILEQCTYLIKNNLAQIANDSELLSLSRNGLLELIVKNSINQYSPNGSLVIIALYAVKQLAYLLCFYGVHTAHLYINNLTRGITELSEKFRSLELLLEDSYRKTCKQITVSHPALYHIDVILRSNFNNPGKILIVADRALWLPLTRMLTSSRINYSIYKTSCPPSSNSDKMNDTEFENSLAEGLNFGCLITSHENVFASFPFNKFSLILEYGGPSSLSKIYSLSPNSDHLSQLHFIYVDIESGHLPMSLCEGFDGPQDSRFTMGSVHDQPIVQILNFVPTEESTCCISSESVNQMDSSRDNESVNVQYSAKLINEDSKTSAFPDTVIIVNTQNFDKRMLISRRTSYQKILAMEKRGLQVVERDIGLPLDLIFTAALCLIWYDARNFGDKEAAKIESSYINGFMENIATNILMSLSFSFSGCILIFEGESNFLAAIMESSDALYAAAASLDMNLQLFCSHAPESTDEIILSCIRNTTRLSRGLYPAMPESQSLGESFLTRFPSINPLSAHAILSSGGTLVEFLDWSNECRIQAIGKYYVSRESISLFGSLCKYGEMGESKSVMTECSSIDSDINSNLLPSPIKRQKHAHQAPLLSVNDPFSSVPVDQTIYSKYKSQVFQSHQLRNFANIKEKLKNIEINQYNDAWRKGQTTPSWKDDGVACDYLKENIGNEFDRRKCSLLDENIFNGLDSFDLLVTPEPQSPRSISRKEVGSKNYRSFPTSDEIQSSSRNQSNNSMFEFFKYVPLQSRNNNKVVKEKEHVPEKLMQDHRTKILGLSSHGKVPKVFNDNAFSDVGQASGQEQGPSWTAEFIRQFKEKGITYKQSHQSNTFLNSSGISHKRYSASNSRSPSTIQRPRVEAPPLSKSKQKRVKGRTKPLIPNANERKESSRITRSWTPIDKRARQDLSYTRDGNQEQSKLVWRNRNSPRIDCSIKKRCRDEG